MGLLLTLGALTLTIVALASYIHDPKLDPAAMAALIAPVGAGGLLFYGIRATEGYFAQQQTNTQPNHVNDDQPPSGTK